MVYESPKELLEAILRSLNTSPRRTLTEGADFSDTREMAKTIEAFLEGVEEGMGFDPYTDPDTRAMLERAGINTSRRRNRR